MAVQNALEKEVSANEFVTMHARTRLSIQSSYWYRFEYLGHVARLAGLFAGVVAVQPFLIGHLLGQAADFSSVRTQCFRLQSMTAAAQSRVANLIALLRHKTAGRRLHHAPMSSINYKWPVLRSLICVVRTGDNNIPIVRFAGSQSLLLNLVTNGARDSVRRRTMLLVRRRYWKVGENLCLLPLRFRRQVRNGHMANRTFIFDVGLRFRVIQRLPTHAALPVGVARGIGHDAGPPLESNGNIFSGTCFQVVVTGDAPVGCTELRVQILVFRSGPRDHRQRQECG